MLSMRVNKKQKGIVKNREKESCRVDKGYYKIIGIFYKVIILEQNY